VQFKASWSLWLFYAKHVKHRNLFKEKNHGKSSDKNQLDSVEVHVMAFLKDKRKRKRHALRKSLGYPIELFNYYFFQTHSPRKRLLKHFYYIYGHSFSYVKLFLKNKAKIIKKCSVLPKNDREQ